MDQRATANFAARPISLAETTLNCTNPKLAGFGRHDDGAMIIGCGDAALAIELTTSWKICNGGR